MSTPGLVGYVDWTVVIVAAISAVPATVAAVASVLGTRRTKMTNGQKLGDVVGQTHELVASATPIVAAVAARECVPYTDPESPPAGAAA